MLNKKQKTFKGSVLVVLLLLIPSMIYASCTGSSPSWTTTPDYDSVNTCVTNANDGDTINVSAGDAIWSSPLIINKAVILRGGIGGITTITGDVASGTGFIRYQPTTPSESHGFRLTGFTLTTAVNSILYLMHSSATPEYVRIDNNIFTETGTYKTIYVKGTVFGSIDNNVFSGGGAFFAFEGYGTGSVQWAGVTREYGSQYNLYIEDNTFSGSGYFSTGGQGGRHVSRYNTYRGTFRYLYDYHGNQPGGLGCTGNSTCGNASTMITEIYGNHWTKTNGYTNLVSDHRGGWANVFMNLLDTSTSASTNSMKIREEYSDDLWPVGSYAQHPTNSYYWANWNVKSTGTVLMSPYIDTTENGCAGMATYWQPNNLYGSASASSDIYNQRFTNDPNKYCWKKTVYDGGMVEPYLTGSTEPDWSSVAPRYIIADGNIHWINMGNGTPIYENVDIFTQRSTGIFDGSGSASHGGGVGCGPLTKIPATCTTGVAYWATNQSCTDMTGMVGANPSNPISGTLYKCTSTNTWEPYYTPYTYPHPLRNSSMSYTENTQEPPPTIPEILTTSPTVSVSPTTKDFGSLPINTSSSAQKFTVTATRGSFKVDTISMAGTDATQFVIQNDSCTGKIIDPETGSCTFEVKFSPSSVGAKTANVSIVNNDSNTTEMIALNGTGIANQVPTLSFSPTSFLYGVLSDAWSSPQTITLSNTGAAPVTISSLTLSGTNANQFSIPIATDYCTGETVAAYGNCSFQVIFYLASTGKKTADVNVTALYYDSPASLALFGYTVIDRNKPITISKKK